MQGRAAIRQDCDQAGQDRAVPTSGFCEAKYLAIPTIRDYRGSIPIGSIDRSSVTLRGERMAAQAAEPPTRPKDHRHPQRLGHVSRVLAIGLVPGIGDDAKPHRIEYEAGRTGSLNAVSPGFMGEQWAPANDQPSRNCRMRPP
jgi:hypothetical protein